MVNSNNEYIEQLEKRIVDQAKLIEDMKTILDIEIKNTAPGEEWHHPAQHTSLNYIKAAYKLIGAYSQ